MRGIAVEVGFDDTVGSGVGLLLGLSDGPGLIDGNGVPVGPLDTDMLGIAVEVGFDETVGS